MDYCCCGLTFPYPCSFCQRQKFFEKQKLVSYVRYKLKLDPLISYENFCAKIHKDFNATGIDVNTNNELIVKIPSDKIVAFLNFLAEHENLISRKPVDNTYSFAIDFKTEDSLSDNKLDEIKRELESLIRVRFAAKEVIWKW